MFCIVSDILFDCGQMWYSLLGDWQVVVIDNLDFVWYDNMVFCQSLKCIYCDNV